MRGVVLALAALGIAVLIAGLGIIVGSSSYLSIKATMPDDDVVGVNYASSEAVEDIDRRRGGGGGGMMACKGISDYTPGQNIRWLLENHDMFNYSYKEFEENMSVAWIIEADDERAAERLYEHVLQMECILENGGAPRSMDPVFWLEAQVKEYIETNATLINDTIVKVVKTGDNECAYETIKLHAEVVKGFFERGVEEARETHPVPDDVLELCEPYIEG